MKTNRLDIRKIIDDVLETEAESILDLKKNIPVATWQGIVDVILKARGKVIITGMGKSGIIGRKISSTLASTGTPSFYIHPADAWHGDLGMINRDDVVVLISNSGETNEVLNLISFLKENRNVTISITGNPSSTLARNTDFTLNIHVKKEACPLQLAPTSSTTATLAIGDALAVLLMQARGFTQEDFSRFHPGGSLGRMLLTHVDDVMRTNDLPILPPSSSVKDLISVMTRGRLGLVIIRSRGKTLGLITDGDLRRAMEKYGSNLFSLKITSFMTQSPKTIETGTKLAEVEAIMNKYKITSLLVMKKGILAGVVQIYDL
jgi:arabinose-5-phosphate isomerase